MQSLGVRSCFQYGGNTPRQKPLTVLSESNWTLDAKFAKKKSCSPLLHRPAKAEIEGSRTALTRFRPGNQRIIPDPYPTTTSAPRTLSRHHPNEATPQRTCGKTMVHPYYNADAGGIVAAQRQVFNHQKNEYVQVNDVIGLAGPRATGQWFTDDAPKATTARDLQRPKGQLERNNCSSTGVTVTTPARRAVTPAMSAGSPAPNRTPKETTATPCSNKFGLRESTSPICGGSPFVGQRHGMSTTDIAGSSPKVFARTPRNKPDMMRDVHDIKGAAPRVFPKGPAAQQGGSVVAGRPQTAAATFGKRRCYNQAALSNGTSGWFW